MIMTFKTILGLVKNEIKKEVDRIVYNYTCISKEKKVLSLLSAYFTIYAVENEYLDPYACTAASSFLAGLGIYGTYSSLMRIVKNARRTLDRRNTLNIIRMNRPASISSFTNLPSRSVELFLKKLAENKDI